MASGALVSFNPLPVAGFPDGSRAIVRVAWAPLRREPSHRAEMVNQLLLGEVVAIRGSGAKGWLEVRAPDGYEGHVTTGALRAVTAQDAAMWAELAVAYSLGLRLNAGGDGGRIGRAPWGARLPPAVDGATVLPDGRLAVATHADRLLPPAEREKRFARAAAAAAATALTWMGAPYLWGGRICSGTDCSGLVQSVFAVHRIDVPRDSRDQAELTKAIPAAEGWEGAQRGDLLYFAWDGGPVSHVGISLGAGEMVHSSETRGGVAVDRLGSGEFGRHLAGGYAGAVRLSD